MSDIDALAAFVETHPRLFVLTGAGVSTASGIPGYRDKHGQWQRKQPVTHQEFTGSEAVRKRYWARSLLGFAVMARAKPNAAHAALAQLEQYGRIGQLVTQNVDGLHQRAGSRRVIELHGGIRQVVCMACTAIESREQLQARLEAANPSLLALRASIAPDGDADLDIANFDDVVLPACLACGGMLKPDVVFYGASVPRVRADAAMAALQEADAILVAGSSLMVYSGYRFCERASAERKPIAAVNWGQTRADSLLSLKVEGDCVDVLSSVLSRLGGGTVPAPGSGSSAEPAAAQ